MQEKESDTPKAIQSDSEPDSFKNSHQTSLRSVQGNLGLFEALSGRQQIFPTDEIETSFEHQPECSRWLRFFVFLLLTAATFFLPYQYFVGLVLIHQTDEWNTQIKDYGFNLTKFANSAIQNSWSLGRNIIISTSIVIDVNHICLLCYWFIYVRNSRILICAPAFYLFRAFTQSFFLLPFPDDYYFPDPGFPSIACPYRKTADFYYSGHVGFLVMLTCEWYINKQYVAMFLNWIGIVYISVTMVMLRIHYSIDILFGAIMGHYTWQLSNKYYPYVDRFFARFYAKILSHIVQKSETKLDKKSLKDLENNPVL